MRYSVFDFQQQAYKVYEDARQWPVMADPRQCVPPLRGIGLVDVTAALCPVPSDARAIGWSREAEGVVSRAPGGGMPGAYARGGGIPGLGAPVPGLGAMRAPAISGQQGAAPIRLFRPPVAATLGQAGGAEAASADPAAGVIQSAAAMALAGAMERWVTRLFTGGA